MTMQYHPALGFVISPRPQDSEDQEESNLERRFLDERSDHSDRSFLGSCRCLEARSELPDARGA